MSNRFVAVLFLITLMTLSLFSFQGCLTASAGDSWTTEAPMPTVNSGVKAVVADGKIYAMCSSVQVYDPSTDSWITKASAPTPRSGHCGICLIQNKIYSIGEQVFNNETEPTGVNEVYDIASDTWSVKSPMPTPRIVTAVHVIDGKIYIIGGEAKDLSPVNANEVYNPQTDTWTTNAPLPTLRIALCSHVVDGKIYVIGGRGDYIEGRATSDSVFDTNEVYDPVTNTWATKTSMPSPDEGYLSCVLDANIYVFGRNGTYIYNTKTDTWRTSAAIPTYQYSEVVATIGVNAPKKIYVIGGYTNPFPNSDIFLRIINLTQIYDPATDSWSMGSTMPTERASVCVVNVNDVFYALGGCSITPGIIGLISSTYDTNERYLPVGYGNPDPSYVPKVAIMSPLNQKYNEANVALTFTVDKPVSWLGYSLDGQHNTTVTGNITLSGLSVGSHTLTVYARDSFGNEAASDTLVFAVSAVPFPIIPITLAACAVPLFAVSALLYRRKHSRSTNFA